MVTLYQASGATRTQRWLGKHGATDVVGPLEARGHFSYVGLPPVQGRWRGARC